MTPRSPNRRICGALVLALAAGCAPHSGSAISPDTPTERQRDAERASVGNATALGAASGAVPTSDTPGIQYFGRWRIDDRGATASWGAVYFAVRFEGTSIALELEDPNNDFQYRIDGGAMTRLSPTLSTHYPLARGLSDSEHLLEVFRRTGGSWGRTVVHGVVLDPGKRVLAPPSRPKRKLEILGDSISLGFGDEGNGANGSSRHNENGYAAYGPELARMLGAEWRVVAHSGQGLFRNLGEPKSSISKHRHMLDEFKLTFFPDSGDNPAWDFASWAPDVFIVMLGTNDFAWPDWKTKPNPAYQPTHEEFIGAYRGMLEFVRNAYPRAEVFGVGTLAANPKNQFGVCNAYICETVTSMHDAHMHCVDPGATSPSGAWLTRATDFIGDWTHPTVAAHAIIARHLAEIIRPIMAW